MRNPSLFALTTGLVSTAGCGVDAGSCDLSLTCSTYAQPGLECTLDAGPDPRCGVFAAPGQVSGGDGSQALPYTSLQAAISAAAAEGKAVYACAKRFDEAIQVPSGAVLYGGLDCDAGWGWVAGGQTLVSAPASAGSGGSEIAARLLAGSGKTVLQDVTVIAPAGVLPGVSSIAVLLEDTRAELSRCTFTAGDGTAGADGLSVPDDASLNGIPGVAGFGICGAASTNPGPEGPSKTCGGGVSAGGDGGDGGLPSATDLAGGDGVTGLPQDSSGTGLGGSGQAALACKAGGQGADGALGSSGWGAIGMGTISVSGFAGVRGGDGTDGRPGQGGGGGGGSKGKLGVVCAGSATLDRAGATGGSGGSGGCGGAKGGGGQSGGASLALVSLSLQEVTLTEVTLIVGAGGDGGDGGDGQSGGTGGLGATGGPGATGANNGCASGDGGRGGAGGPGGGGMGGHAIGLAWKGLPPLGAPSVTYAGSPGIGGHAGMNSLTPMGAGADGASGDVVEISGP